MSFKYCFVAMCLAVFPALAQATPFAVEPRVMALEKGAEWTKFRFIPEVHGGVWLEGDVTIANPAKGVEGVERHELLPVIFQVALDQAAVLQVTDAWLYGDVFDVSWGDQTLTTSSVGTLDLSKSWNGTECCDIRDDYDAAFLDSRWSSGSWLLEPGTYFISGKANPALMEGSGALRVVDVAAVPVPASLAFLLSTCAAFGAVTVRRRRIN